jgi:hypothetical protein
MKPLGQRVERCDPPDGHWVAETAPDEMLAALTALLTPPYRNASARRNAVAADSRVHR